MRKLDIFQNHIAAMPQGFLRIGNAHTAQLYAVHLAKHLRSLHQSVGHLQPARVPQRRTGAVGKTTALYPEAVDIPERILAFKDTIDRLDIGCSLESRLAGVHSHIVEPKPAGGEKADARRRILYL